MKRDAVIDETGQYRYLLTRQWGGPEYVAWIMLNPSTADAMQDDPTIRRCINFSKQWGFGALRVVNLYAYRSTSPKALSEVNDPVGPDHHQHFRNTIEYASCIVAAWGSHPSVRTSHIVELLADRSIVCLGINKDGNPKHPLYVRGDAAFTKYEAMR